MDAQATDPGVFAAPDLEAGEPSDLARLLGVVPDPSPPRRGRPGDGPRLAPTLETEPMGDLLARMTPIDAERAEDVVEAQRQAVQAVLEERQIEAELARQARRLGMNLPAFQRLIERDPQLAAEVLAEQERAERARARVGMPGGPEDAQADAGEAVNIEDLARRLSAGGDGGVDDLDADGGGFDPDAVAARARAMVPVYSRQVWTVMFPPPGYGGKDPRFVHEAKLVPNDRVGEYARLGFTFKPMAPLVSDKDRPVECGMRTNLGTVCRKRFDTVQHRLLHWQVKHPSEYQALLHAAREAEERRQREQWELEREERRLQIELQRRQLEVLERQARQLAAIVRADDTGAPPQTADAGAPSQTTAGSTPAVTAPATTLASTSVPTSASTTAGAEGGATASDPRPAGGTAARAGRGADAARSAGLNAILGRAGTRPGRA